LQGRLHSCGDALTPPSNIRKRTIWLELDTLYGVHAEVELRMYPPTVDTTVFNRLTLEPVHLRRIDASTQSKHLVKMRQMRARDNYRENYITRMDRRWTTQ